MSVILECQSGDEFVCIQAFHASPEGEGFSWDTCRHFRIGERLRYLGCKQDPRLADRPNGWMVVFEAADGKRYAATQTYFVTGECWDSIKEVLAKKGEPMVDPRRIARCRDKLIEVAKRRGTITYGDLAAHIGVVAQSIGPYLNAVYNEEVIKSGHPDLTLLAVYAGTRHGRYINQGLPPQSVEFNPNDPDHRRIYDEERERVYQLWV